MNMHSIYKTLHMLCIEINHSQHSNNTSAAQLYKVIITPY